MSARLQWRTLGPNDEPWWELVLIEPAGDKLWVTPMGRLYVTQDGYYCVTNSPHGSAFPIGTYLTLDEAKSAAKLLIMTRE